jgi:hypothetical protein
VNQDPRAIRIVNEFIRPGADRFVGTILEGDALLTLSQVQNSAAVFPQNLEVVDDGAAVDGRPPVTNVDVLLGMAAAAELVAWARTPLAKLGGKTPLETFAKLSVNPR